MASDFPFPVVPVFSEERGEGLAASRRLSEGELVLRVAPFASAPKDACIHRACAACFSRLPAARSSNESDSTPHGPAVNHADASMELRMEEQPPARDALCQSCKAVSFCSRCAADQGVQERHRCECQALGDIIRMAEQQGQQDHAGCSDRRGGGGGGCAVDTTTVRLLLSIACAVARSRLQKKKQKPDQAASPGHGQQELGSGQEEGSGREEDGLFGAGDVVLDSAEDLEQLMGDPEVCGGREGRKGKGAHGEGGARGGRRSGVR
jgi:hypothetical protein